MLECAAAVEVISKLDGETQLETVTEDDIRDIIINRGKNNKGL